MSGNAGHRRADTVLHPSAKEHTMSDPQQPHRQPVPHSAPRRAPAPVLTARGQRGVVTFDGVFVTIARGATGRLMTGSGEKRIHIRNIAGINFKPATLLVQGWIQFTVPGGLEKRAPRGGWRAKTVMHDENGITFLKKSNAEFAALKDAIYAAQARVL
ncbi:MAG: DUF4429 domain-containing protein [Solirubrobacteraceae bacterium]